MLSSTSVFVVVVIWDERMVSWCVVGSACLSQWNEWDEEVWRCEKEKVEVEVTVTVAVTMTVTMTVTVTVTGRETTGWENVWCCSRVKRKRERERQREKTD